MPEVFMDMTDGPVLLHRRDPARNMARHYTLSVEVTLFEDFACTRTFGRIGGRGGRIMVGLYPTREAARAALRDLLRRKLRRGYSPVGETAG
jgi:predicted DNA-binding WGR domain protein